MTHATCDLPDKQLGPGVCEVPPQVTEHWYFQANVRSGNITIIEPAPVAA
jgi:hypothetical protein